MLHFLVYLDVMLCTTHPVERAEFADEGLTHMSQLQ